MTKPAIGFIGLGTMGAPMARNLLVAGWPVTVYHPIRERAQPFIAAGAKAAESPAQLAQACDVVWLMLPDDAAVEKVITGSQGIQSAARNGLVVIDSSTIHPTTSRTMEQGLRKKGVTYLDAPVTGSQAQAESKQLMFLVGGDRSAYERMAPFFEAIGRRHVYLGESGVGSSIKLAANMMGAINMLAFAEALALIIRAGIEPATFLDIVNQSGARSLISEVKGPKVIAEDWSPNFALGLMLKDLTLAHKWAEDLHAHTPVLQCAESRYRLAVDQLGRDGDMCSVARTYSTEASSVS